MSMNLTPEERTTAEAGAHALVKALKHEPGPWILGGCSGRMIATPSGYVGDGFIADVDTLENARLIAAAPELLSIAQRWAAIDGGAWHVERHAREKAELLAETRAAIAKALGES